ncbi:unnamed protein product [Orchesella dallaii]|uniref:Odorant receptor n=1 Tax=Orchesella dallaii TaxID=48710 RepID=A0ABP1RBX2_9HEXA
MQSQTVNVVKVQSSKQDSKSSHGWGRLKRIFPMSPVQSQKSRTRIICRHLKATVSTFKNQINVASFFNFVPFHCKNIQNETLVLSTANSKKQVFTCKFWKILTWLNGSIIIVRLIHTSKTEGLKLEDGTGLLHIMWATVYMFLCIVFYHVTSKAQEFCQVTNNIMRLAQAPRNKSAKVAVGKSLRVLTFFQFLGASFAPFFLPTLCWVTPCSPQFFGSMFLNCSEDGQKDITILQRTFIYIFEVILIYGPCQITGVTYISAVLLTEFLNRYAENLKREITKFRWKKFTVSKINRQGKRYREIQLLVGLYNACFKTNLLPNIHFTGSILIICALFGIIEFGQRLAIPAKVFFVFIILVASIVLTYMLEVSSKIMLVSKSIRMRLKQCQLRVGLEAPWLKRFAKSCSILSIYNGVFHAVDRQRLPIVFRFCLQRTVFLTVYASRRG